MMARSSKAPSIGRIQKRKTNLLQIIIFGLQRAAGPYRWVINVVSSAAAHFRSSPDIVAKVFLHDRSRNLLAVGATFE